MNEIKLDNKELETLRQTFIAANSWFIRQELDAESENDRKYYFECEKEVHKLEEKLLSIPTGSQIAVDCDTSKTQNEKKYRPFRTIEEFRKALNNIDFGQPIEYRDRNGKQYVAVWNGYLEKNDKLEIISLGCWGYTTKVLFEYFNFYNEQTEEYQPFGVVSDENEV